jgi:flagellar FliL protein
MSMAAKPAPKPAPAAAGAPAAEPKKGFPIVLVLIVLVVGLGAGGGAAYFMLPKGESEAHAEEDPRAGGERKTDKRLPAQYVAMEPAFVVNLADEGSTRYLQTEIQVMARDPQTIADLTTHMPAVRNALLMLFARQTQAELRSPEGREALQTKSLEEINRVLKEETGYDGVEALFFTSFVTQ